MNLTDVTQARLNNLGISNPTASSVYEVVKHLGAMQAQDYPGACWSLGLRIPDSTFTSVEEELAAGTVVRTWPMRGTLHFVAAEDAKWMCKLLSPRVLSGAASRERNLELDDTVFRKAFGILENELADGRPHQRTDILAALDAAGIATANQRGYHILWRAAQIGLICLGPVVGKQPTYVLLDAWVKKHAHLDGDEAVTELARRFFRSHGPATEKDFAGWTKLPLGVVRPAIRALGPDFIEETVSGITYILPHTTSIDSKPSVALLPGFDEYMLGYKDRSAALHSDHANHIVPGNNGMFLATIVVDGQVVGTWKRVVRAKTVTIVPLLFAGKTLKPRQHVLLQQAADRYGAFIDREAIIAT